MDSPSELLCFVSFEKDKPTSPILKHLDFDEIRKIQKGVPLVWPKEMGEATWSVSVEPLEQILKDKGFLNSDSCKEFFIICRSSVLTLLFYKHWVPKTEFKIEKKGNIIVIEEILSEKEKVLQAQEVRIETQMGCIAETQLVKLPNGEKAKVHGSDDVFIMTKKRFEFIDGTIVNLFISSEIDAIYEKGKGLIPLDLKLCTPKSLSNKEMFSKNFKQAMYADYMIGAITYLIGLQNEYGATPEKITVVDNISSICASDHLKHFKSKLPELLLKLTQLNSANGMITKEVLNTMYEDADVEIFYKSGESDSQLLMRYSYKFSSSNEPRINSSDSTLHELIIMGSFEAPLAHKKLLNTDFITMEHFKKGCYKEFLAKPDKIIFYGTMEEYAQVLRYMSSEQMDIASHVIRFSEEKH